MAKKDIVAMQLWHSKDTKGGASVNISFSGQWGACEQEAVDLMKSW